MRIIGNVFWIIFGGALLATLWFVIAIICLISIVGIPLGIQSVKFASFVLYPFGRNIESGYHTGSFLMNIIWILFFGWELAIISIIIGIIWCVTIVGIPFGIQCFKFAQLALMPFGSKIIRKN